MKTLRFYYRPSCRVVCLGGEDELTESIHIGSDEDPESDVLVRGEMEDEGGEGWPTVSPRNLWDEEW